MRISSLHKQLFGTGQEGLLFLRMSLSSRVCRFPVLLLTSDIPLKAIADQPVWIFPLPPPLVPRFWFYSSFLKTILSVYGVATAFLLQFDLFVSVLIFSPPLLSVNLGRCPEKGPVVAKACASLIMVTWMNDWLDESMNEGRRSGKNEYISMLVRY